MSSIKMSEVPTFLQNSQTLEFWARHNQVERLDLDNFSKLENLKMLVLMFNRINETVSASSNELTSLEVLELGENRFTKIDSSTFSSLPNLRNISLANNYVQSVTADAFVSNKKLVELVLRNNHIMSEALPIFDEFENLVRLDLSNNHLSHVSKAYFGKMKNLKILRLNNNKITYITSLAFYNLKNIESIDLSLNWLTYINTAVFSPLVLDAPWIIDFAVNPFVCDCTMQTFLVWMTDKSNLAHLKNWDKLQCMAGGDTKSQARFGKLLKDITSERTCDSSLGMVIAIPSAIVGFILLICCIVCVKRTLFSETKEIEEFERNEAERQAAEDADSLGQDEQGNQVGLPVSLMPTVNPDLMADRPEVMAAVRQQQLISSGMDPTHARIHAQRAGRDAQAMGYSSSAYGSDDEKQQRQRPDLNATRRDLIDENDAPNYSGGPRGSAF